MSSDRKNIMLGTAGHVDHGKTALVKLLTGCDTDRLAAEKQRGLTIELGFAPCTMSDERIVGIVDVPGHVDFIRNMVAGAHGIDVVILVVAADDGVMPQTREHLDILTLMGVRRGLVALTKIDLVDEDMRKIVTGDVRKFLVGTFLEGAPVCGISNVTGEGFDKFFAALNEVTDMCQPQENWQPFRMWLERSFSARGFGTVVSGIPTSGQVAVGNRLSLMPGGQVVRVRQMEVYGQEDSIGRAGECVAINLADADQESLQRGQALCEENAFEASGMIEAELRLLKTAPRPLKDYTEVHLHIGTADVMAHAALLERQYLEPGERTMVQLRLARPLCIAPGDRFVIRCAAGGPAGGHLTTVGGGRVLSTSNIRLRRNRPWTLESLGARHDAIDDQLEWCELNLRESGEALSVAQLARRSLVPAAKIEAILEDLKAMKVDGAVLAASGGTLVHRDVVNHCAGQIVEALEGFYKSNPLRMGMDARKLCEQVKAPRAVFDLTIGEVIKDGVVTCRSNIVGLVDRAPEMSPEDTKLCDRIESVFLEAHLMAPTPVELVESLNEPKKRIEEMIRLLVEKGTLVRLDRKIVMHLRAVDAAKKVVLGLFSEASGFSTVQFRDALDVSRKYAIPLLDYFDTIPWTVRQGNRRTPGREAQERLSDDPS